MLEIFFIIFINAKFYLLKYNLFKGVLLSPMPYYFLKNQSYQFKKVY